MLIFRCPSFKIISKLTKIISVVLIFDKGCHKLSVFHSVIVAQMILNQTYIFGCSQV